LLDSAENDEDGVSVSEPYPELFIDENSDSACKFLSVRETKAAGRANVVFTFSDDEAC
jgi:hypothetical protein